eukprot:2052321-Rhodomonas_salina.2
MAEMKKREQFAAGKAPAATGKRAAGCDGPIVLTNLQARIRRYKSTHFPGTKRAKGARYLLRERCVVLTSRMLPRDVRYWPSVCCYAVPRTDIKACTELAYPAMRCAVLSYRTLLRGVRYAICSTELAYAATRRSRARSGLRCVGWGRG